jgi:hypothetical protein
MQVWSCVCWADCRTGSVVTVGDQSKADIQILLKKALSYYSILLRTYAAEAKRAALCASPRRDKQETRTQFRNNCYQTLSAMC